MLLPLFPAAKECDRPTGLARLPALTSGDVDSCVAESEQQQWQEQEEVGRPRHGLTCPPEDGTPSLSRPKTFFGEIGSRTPGSSVTKHFTWSALSA